MNSITGTLTPVATINGMLAVANALTAVLNAPVGIECTLTPVATLNGVLAVAETITGSMYVPLVISDTPAFTGEYEYTPTGDTQTIEIEGLRALENITINPIPSNYGLITWDGAKLTVS